ncbi:hypothetical protein Y1Q_0017973 [Alligator mississippiensis]|uniref:Uncharacterized protein n=1 Tax=Alligator mississippiensis TaxID=8496 RepID=A0A151MXP4_ALLMI|nr:hypothetical protein Y1Q_0017973 [Alligator mississippiensis]
MEGGIFLRSYGSPAFGHAPPLLRLESKGEGPAQLSEAEASPESMPGCWGVSDLTSSSKGSGTDLAAYSPGKKIQFYKES